VLSVVHLGALDKVTANRENLALAAFVVYCSKMFLLSRSKDAHSEHKTGIDRVAKCCNDEIHHPGDIRRLQDAICRLGD
jgi:hypothetical protein